jgi:hypothetical protein
LETAVFLGVFMVWKINSYLHIQSLPITPYVLPTDEVYSIQHYVIKLVTLNGLHELVKASVLAKY